MAKNKGSLMLAARELVLEAGEIIRRNNLKPRRIRAKGRIDLVTDTDVEVEDFLKHHLMKLTPEADFIAEEGSPRGLTGNAEAAGAWIVDPLDGTTNFAHGLPLVATSVAFWSNGRVEAGIVNLPLLGECFWAERGGGAYRNGEPLKVSLEAEPGQALLATGFPYNLLDVFPAVTGRFERALMHCRGVRRCGAAAMDLAYTAAGRFDGFFGQGLKPWDMAAGWLLLEEAGGMVTGLDGQPLDLWRGDILGANRSLHGNLLKILD